MVYGFVRQSGGHVAIFSQPGAGTAVKLYLPRLTAPPEPRVISPDDAAPQLRATGENVLVVEDDVQVKLMIGAVLADFGYRVFEAVDANAALEFLKSDENLRSHDHGCRPARHERPPARRFGAPVAA